MEFKKRYVFRDLILFVIMMGIILVGGLALIAWMIAYGVSTVWDDGVTIGIVCIGICDVGSLVIILVLCQWVTIDEEKIESKTLFQGVYLSFNIKDIYKIEKKPGAKGTVVFVIHANTPQIKPRKIETINLGADEKREKILRHFITNPDVWDS